MSTSLQGSNSHGSMDVKTATPSHIYTISHVEFSAAKDLRLLSKRRSLVLHLFRIINLD